MRALKNKGKSDNFTIERGAHVLIHNNSIFPLVKFQGINVQTGSATNIGVLRSIYKKFSSPNLNCRENLEVLETDSLYYKLATKISTTETKDYYQRLCYEIFIQLTTIIPSCNCMDPSVIVPNLNASICKSKAELKCVNYEKSKFNQTISTSDCPKECQSVLYTTNVNSANYPTEYYKSILKQNENLIDKFNFISRKSHNKKNSTNSKRNKEKNRHQHRNRPSGTDLTSSFLKISVYYDDLRYTLVEEIPEISFETLIGVIGN